MSKNVANVSGSAKSISFDVILTYRITHKNLQKIDEANLPSEGIGGWQVRFSHKVPFSDTSKYDDIMKEIQDIAVRHGQELCGIGREEITHISTAADWSEWERLTKLDVDKESEKSSVSRDGKFVLPAFFEQNRAVEALGKTLNDLAAEIATDYMLNKRTLR